MAFLGVRFVAGFLHSWPLSMAARRLRRLLICVVLNVIIITFDPLLLLYFLLFTSPQHKREGDHPFLALHYAERTLAPKSLAQPSKWRGHALPWSSFEWRALPSHARSLPS
jgi:hypothetical protein